MIAALWLGGGAFLLFIGAPAAFKASDSPMNAASVVGAMLTRWHYIGLLLPLLLLAIEWRHARPRLIAILSAAIVLAALQAVVDLRIRAIRAQSPVPISSLDRNDPIRKRFGVLHGISSVLLLGQVVLATAGVALSTGDTNS